MAKSPSDRRFRLSSAARRNTFRCDQIFLPQTCRLLLKGRKHAEPAVPIKFRGIWVRRMPSWSSPATIPKDSVSFSKESRQVGFQFSGHYSWARAPWQSSKIATIDFRKTLTFLRSFDYQSQRNALLSAVFGSPSRPLKFWLRVGGCAYARSGNPPWIVQK
jgi:hypothetical protein